MELDIKATSKPFNTNVTFDKDIHDKIVKIAKLYGITNSKAINAILRKALFNGSKDSK